MLFDSKASANEFIENLNQAFRGLTVETPEIGAAGLPGHWQVSLSFRDGDGFGYVLDSNGTLRQFSGPGTRLHTHSTAPGEVAATIATCVSFERSL